MSTELAVRNGNVGEMVHSSASTNMTFEQTVETAKMLAASGYFKDAREAAQAFAKILAGQEIGIGSMQAMAGIYIVEGKPSFSATLMAAQVKRSKRYDYRIGVWTPSECTIDFYEHGQHVGPSSFTIQDARDAGLIKPNSPWQKYPRNMLFARAMSNGVRAYCPDVFMAPPYTPEELGMEVDPQTGEVLTRSVYNVPSSPARTSSAPQGNIIDVTPQAASASVDPRDAEWNQLIKTEGFCPNPDDPSMLCEAFTRLLGRRVTKPGALSADQFRQAREELERRNSGRRFWFKRLSELGLHWTDEEQRAQLGLFLSSEVVSRGNMTAAQWRKALEELEIFVSVQAAPSHNAGPALSDDETDPFATDDDPAPPIPAQAAGQ